MPSAVFDKPTLLQRVLPMLRGFDWPLIGLLLLLTAIGLTAMYSSGYDHGTRFADHGRNILLAAGILFFVAQIPPQKLMLLAVPLYTLGVALLIAVALFGITKKGAQRWINVGVVIQPSELLKIATPLMLGAKQNVLDSLAASVPFPKRLGKPEEFGSLALELARNSYFNGQCIRLDGAIRMAPR